MMPMMCFSVNRISADAPGNDELEAAGAQHVDADQRERDHGGDVDRDGLAGARGVDVVGGALVGVHALAALSELLKALPDAVITCAVCGCETSVAASATKTMPMSTSMKPPACIRPPRG